MKLSDTSNIVREKKRAKMSFNRNLLNIIIILCVCFSWDCSEGARAKQRKEIDSHTIQLNSLFPSPSSPCVLSARGNIPLANSIHCDSLCFSVIHKIDAHCILHTHIYIYIYIYTVLACPFIYTVLACPFIYLYYWFHYVMMIPMHTLVVYEYQLSYN